MRPGIAACPAIFHPRQQPHQEVEEMLGWPRGPGWLVSKGKKGEVARLPGERGMSYYSSSRPTV